MRKTMGLRAAWMVLVVLLSARAASGAAPVQDPFKGRWGGSALKVQENWSVPSRDWRVTPCEDLQVWITKELQGEELVAVTVARSLICEGKQQLHFPYYRFSVRDGDQLFYKYRRSGRVVPAGRIDARNIQVRIPMTDGYLSIRAQLTEKQLQYHERDYDSGRARRLTAVLKPLPVRPPEESED